MSSAHRSPFKYSWARVEVELNDTNQPTRSQPNALINYQLT